MSSLNVLVKHLVAFLVTLYNVYKRMDPFFAACAESRRATYVLYAVCVLIAICVHSCGGQGGSVA